jgi:hypothetical protein
MGRGKSNVFLGRSIAMATVWLLKHFTQACCIACHETNGVQLSTVAKTGVDSGRCYTIEHGKTNGVRVSTVADCGTGVRGWSNLWKVVLVLLVTLGSITSLISYLSG